mgnify:CR=1 FL=1
MSGSNAVVINAGASDVVELRNLNIIGVGVSPWNTGLNRTLIYNKSGDLISRINNDTDKLNQFFAQGLVQLAGNLFLMAGAAICLVAGAGFTGIAGISGVCFALFVETHALHGQLFERGIILKLLLND